MSDREAIAALIHRYAELLDAGRLAEVAELFSQGTWRSGATGRALTQEQVRGVYDQVILYDDGTPRTHHLITNLMIDVTEGADEASASCYFTVLQGVDPAKPIETIVSGRYVDQFRRGTTGWYFHERVFHADLVGDQSRHFRGGGP
ncbi:MAG: nuclear transport factor 2 family protein [Mycobacteriales bacterium]